MMLKASRRALVVGDLRAAVAPLLDQVAQRFLAFPRHPPVVLERKPARLGDVAEVGGDRRHAAAAAGDLDHHLRSAPQHGRFQTGAHGGGAMADGQGGEARRARRPDDPIPRIEQSLAPLDQGGING